MAKLFLLQLQISRSFLFQYQAGGTVVICNNWVSRITNKGEDPLGLGRWSFFTLRGKGLKKVIIITTYNASPTSSDTTNFRQQQRCLTSLHHAHNQHVTAQPRRQLILDLKAWIEHLVAQDHDIILAMDSNCAYDPKHTVPVHPLPYLPGVPTIDRKHNGALSTLLSTCGVADPLACQYSSCPFPASHIQGTNQIDYIFTSTTLLSAVIASGCLSFPSLFNSDHRAYYLDIDSILLFADPAYEIIVLHRHAGYNSKTQGLYNNIRQYYLNNSNAKKSLKS